MKLTVLFQNRKLALFFLLAALGVMGLAWGMISGVDGYFQRIYAPPAQAPLSTADGAGGMEGAEGAGEAGTSPSGSEMNTGLRDARAAAKALTATLEGACDRTALYAVAQPAAVSVEEGGSADARLLGIQSDYFGLHQLTLYCGRLPSPDELLYGERVALVDEALAVKLFQYAEPLNEKIVLAGQKYEIVGVVRGGKRVGDELDYTLYVPFGALEKSAQPLSSLVYEARPIPGAGGWSAFETAAQTLGTEGSTINLLKERMNAAMPLRLLGVLCGAAAALFCLRLLNSACRLTARRYRALLLDCYAVKLTGWLLWRGVLLALGYAACALLLAWLFVRLVEPVYTFPEWVPAVLVEPKDIQTAFWNVWQKSARTVERRTPELLRLRFWRELMGWAAGAAALLGGALWGRVTQVLAPKRNAGAEEEGQEDASKG